MQIVIIGAGYAGLSCALRLARKTRGRAQVTLINGREQFVERIRLHEQAAGTEPRALALRSLLEGTGVELVLGWVSQLDLRAKTLQLGERTLRWDRLVLALGSDNDRGHVEGAREHAYTLSADQLPALSSTLRSLAGRAGRAVVVGGGLTGIEAASELAETYPRLHVSLLTRGELAPELSAAARRHVRSVLTELGVQIEEHSDVLRVEARHVLTQARVLASDVCIWSAGFVAPALARDAGLSVNGAGQVWVDDRLCAREHPDVFVIGDLAKLEGERGEALPMGCKLAMPMGLYLADSLARTLETGEAADPFTFRPPLYCVSLGRRDALVQTLPVSAPGARAFGGWLAVRIKEWICRGTLLMLRWERRRAVLSAMLPARTPRALPKPPPADRATERLHV